MKNSYSFLIISILICFSCNKKEENMDDFPSAICDISFIDASGTDLLCPNTKGAYTLNDVTYYLRGGSGLLYKHYNPGEGNLRWMNINNDDSGKYFKLQFSATLMFTSFFTTDTIFLKFRESDFDTIRCEFKYLPDKYFVFCKKVWYNDKLCWNIYDTKYSKDLVLIK